MTKPSADSSTTKSSAITGWRWLVREVIAASIWLSSLFLLIGPNEWTSPIFRQLHQNVSVGYILIFVFLILGLSWAVGLRTMWHIAFIAGYPAIVVLRFVPALLAKHWPILIVFLPSVRGIVRELRLRTGIFFLALSAAIGACIINDQGILQCCWIALIAYLTWTFWLQLRLAYRPMTAYSEIVDILQRVSDKLPHPRELFAKSLSAQNTDNNKENPATAVAGQLAVFYCVSTSLHYIAVRMEAVHRSFKFDVYLLYSVIKSFVLTVVTFAIIFASMARLGEQHFVAPPNASATDFIMFSFCNLMTSEISGVEPSSSIAKLFACTELFFSFGLLVLIVFVVFTSMRERHNQDMKEVVLRFRKGSTIVAEVFETDYALTIAAVEQMLAGYIPAVARWFISMRHGRDHADKLIRQAKEAADLKKNEELIDVPGPKKQKHPSRVKAQPKKNRKKQE